jgi:hypothetical protein
LKREAYPIGGVGVAGMQNSRLEWISAKGASREMPWRRKIEPLENAVSLRFIFGAICQVVLRMFPLKRCLITHVEQKIRSSLL